MSYFHKSLGQDMLKKSSDKLHWVKHHRSPFVLPSIFTSKLNGMVVKAFNTVIRNSYPKDVPGKIVQRVLPFPHGLAIDYPLMLPNVRIDFIKQLSLFHSIPELGFKNGGQRFCVNKQVFS
jgi:hypothetical protein